MNQYMRLFFNICEEVRNMRRWPKVIAVSVLFFLFSSCRKFLEIQPPIDQAVRSALFANDESAFSAMRGVYSEMVTNSGIFSGYTQSVGYKCALSADEMRFLHPGTDDYAFFENSLTPTVSQVTVLWSNPYKFVYDVNAILEELESTKSITESTKNQLIGESRFVRAFSYFHLVNLFDEIPLVVTTDYQSNRTASRVSKNRIYQQMIDDLKVAELKLKNDFSASENLRVRPNKFAATAMLARVHLYLENWQEAERYASDVIESGIFHLPTDLNEVFKANTTEAIWQLMPLNRNCTPEGDAFIIMDQPAAVMTDHLLLSFESGDKRRVDWVNSIAYDTNMYFFPFKYKENPTNGTNAEFSVVLRLAEQYLIRAEARAHQNKLTGVNSAESDLNVIRSRAGLGNISFVTQADLLLAIEQERRVELFTEWGHRWFDLKRADRADQILGPIKGLTWQSTDILYPIPKFELDNNLNMTQNLGY